MDWLASIDGFNAAVQVERARKQLLCMLNKQHDCEKKLIVAEQEYDEATEQVDLVGSQLLHDSGEATVHHTNHDSLLKQQAAALHQMEAVGIDLKELEDCEHESRALFQNLWLKTTCDQLYHTLPRELRDMIYSDIMKGRVLDQFCRVSKSQVRIQREELMGRDVFSELIQTLCRTAYFEHPLTTKGSLDRFLSRDKWGLGLRLFDYMETVEMKINEAHFTNPTLQENLKTLCQLRKGTKVYFDLRYKGSPKLSTLGTRFLFTCLRCGGKPLGPYISKHSAELLPFSHHLQPLLPIFRQILDAGIVLDITFVIPDLGVKVDFYKHGSSMLLDADNILDLAMEKKKDDELDDEQKYWSTEGDAEEDENCDEQH